MSSFSANWNKNGNLSSAENDGLGAKLRNVIKSPESLKPRLEMTSRQIQVQVDKLNSKSRGLSEKDKIIFEKVVTSLQKRDSQRAKMLANELSEIRKFSKLVTQAKLAFEQIELRISTIRDLGDIANCLSPTVGIIRGIAPGLYNFMPEAQNELGEISSLLSGILVDAGQMSFGSINFETANEEADRILTEAAVIAEESVQKQFPDIPAGVEKHELEPETA
jgi:division protein CdvB (Snf7/Vps24/ESCRT-III family)